jgi:hypothetical protein
MVKALRALGVALQALVAFALWAGAMWLVAGGAHMDDTDRPGFVSRP